MSSILYWLDASLDTGHLSRWQHLGLEDIHLGPSLRLANPIPRCYQTRCLPDLNQEAMQLSCG